MSNNSNCPTDRTRSGATTPGQRVPGSDDNEGILRIPKSYSITEASPSDCLVSNRTLGGEALPLNRDAVGVFYSLIRLDHKTLAGRVLPICTDAVGLFYNPSRQG